MKNRFLVINREKIYAYVVSIMTIVVIFFMTNIMNNNLDNTEEVSSNSIENSEIGEALSTTTGNQDIENEENTNIEDKNEVNNLTNID